MSGRELRDIAIRLFGERGWQKQLAAALERDVSSVRRWIETNEVPRIVELAVRGLEAEAKKQKTPVAGSPRRG